MDRLYGLTCEYQKNPKQIDIPDPRFGWKIEAGGQNVKQAAWEIEVKEAFSGAVVWQKREETDQTTHVVYEGKPLEENKKYRYTVKSILEDGREFASDGTDYFETGIWDQNSWKGIWIGKRDREDLGNCPLFRKSFEVKKQLLRARLFISARGLYEASVNGKVLDEYLFAPGWTNYDRYQQYVAYDVTDLLCQGKNAIGVRLGDGWYNGEISFNHQTHVYGDAASLAAILRLEYEGTAGGSEEEIKTDTSWKTSDSGILQSSIYDGEWYDLTEEPADWNCPSFSDESWACADRMEDTKAQMTGMKNEGTKRIEVIKPVSICKAPNGETIVDMGQNMTGWVRISVEAKQGEKVSIKHGETLDKDGNFYSGNLRLAKQTDTYIVREGKNFLEPHFTFHGFRYLKILDFPGEIKKDNVEGIVLHTAMEPAMEFSCSDPLVNQLWHNLVWGQKGNFLDVPTDCPQRDERLGWTGDAHVFCKTACYNFLADGFFAKWLLDVMADQYENGAIPFVVPDVLPKDWRFMIDAGLGAGHTSAVWGDVITVLPWTMYECYGDERILEQSYESMKKYLSYIYDGAKYGSGNPFLWDWGPQLGDWLGLDSEEGSYRGGTDENYVATVFYAHSARIVSRCAGILKKSEDANYYRELFEDIRKSFHDKYVKDGEITIQTQTAQILALHFELLTEKESGKAIRKLVELLKDKNNHLTTGFAGTPYICHVLTKYGYERTAYELLLQKDFPSWLYQVTRGATTIWEHWDGLKPDGSFWSDDMNSFNHYAYGSIGEWLYRCAAGIDSDEENPGFSHVIIRPVSDANLAFMDCAYESVKGKIVSRWKRNGNAFSLHVEIPANIRATIYLEDGSRHEVGSGSYDFEIEIHDSRPDMSDKELVDHFNLHLKQYLD